jgi:hypothetical protein
VLTPAKSAGNYRSSQRRPPDLKTSCARDTGHRDGGDRDSPARDSVATGVAGPLAPGRGRAGVGEVARRIAARLRPEQVGLVAAGWDVPHAHIHVIPMLDYHDITSKRLLDGQVVPAAPDELARQASVLRGDWIPTPPWQVSATCRQSPRVVPLRTRTLPLPSWKTLSTSRSRSNSSSDGGRVAEGEGHAAARLGSPG